ncbi:MAG: 30S ribosomal protein S6 [Flavobacteriales bacterium]|jgi:small subunit ribosomal protein S6|nr:30S ribosomal protein S6 [Flavobacteriales bacterium]|tara:strand:- start:152 stop:493 length:342 start_codon:yes stop_codon:yes gene_type:complete
MNNYETVLILNPVLSEDQVKDSMEKFKTLLSSFKAELIASELWGLKKMKYSIQNKKTGFYVLFQFKSNPATISDLEVELKRDERIMRFLTVRLDKHAAEYAEKRRNKKQVKEK